MIFLKQFLLPLLHFFLIPNFLKMSLIRNSFFHFILFAFVLYSCNEQDKMEIEKAASAFDIKKGEASVLQTNQTFMKSFKAKDSINVAKCFTSDAKAMAPNQPPVENRENIVHLVGGMISSGITDFKLNTLKIWGDSSILVEEGTYLLLDNKGNQADQGEYISLWQMESGNWKIYREIWTSSIPSSAKKVEAMSLLKN